MIDRSLVLSVSGIAILFLVIACTDRQSENTTTSTEPAVTADVPVTRSTPAEEAGIYTDVITCPVSDHLSYICGPENAEDILEIGDSDWLLVSGMNGAFTGTDKTGHIYLVNHVNKTYEELFPGPDPVFNYDAETFGTCPGPLNIEKFSAHGLALKEQSPLQYRLYITSHGEREAIEVFDIDTSKEKPLISWVGCVPLPEKTMTNSVAILSDGGFITTKFFDPTVPEPFNGIMRGEITGHLYEWHPGGEVVAVPATELSGANGIVLSPDNRWAFVTAMGSRQIVRFDRSVDPVTKDSVEVNILPDNIRWSENGKLYVVGGNYIPPEECTEPPCNTGWSIFEIDPDTLETRRITGVDATEKLQSASVATPVGNEIWVGTYSGDRIAYFTISE